MKVIFLDIDGVVNVIPQGFDKYGGIWHPHLVDNLRYIIEQTGAKIVISSSWRLNGLQSIKNMWKDRNLPGEVIDVTPIYYSYNDLSFAERAERGHEISMWMNEFPVDAYVILDDDRDVLPEQEEHFIITSGNKTHPDAIDIGYGLTRICAEKAIQILNKK